MAVPLPYAVKTLETEVQITYPDKVRLRLRFRSPTLIRLDSD